MYVHSRLHFPILFVRALLIVLHLEVYRHTLSRHQRQTLRWRQRRDSRQESRDVHAVRIILCPSLLAARLRLDDSYIGNEAATKAAFDEEGFFKTGDLGRRIRNQYFFEGRATCDCA